MCRFNISAIFINEFGWGEYVGIRSLYKRKRPLKRV